MAFVVLIGLGCGSSHYDAHLYGAGSGPSVIPTPTPTTPGPTDPLRRDSTSSGPTPPDPLRQDPLRQIQMNHICGRKMDTTHKAHVLVPIAQQTTEASSCGALVSTALSRYQGCLSTPRV